MKNTIIKLMLAAFVASTTSACVMYDNNMHQGMLRGYKHSKFRHGQYDYPPYFNPCPAEYRSKGWC